ncbi:MAG: Rrf2 family transcriptional regulator [Thioalkalivibrio sp.]|nr:MAG: Rrf2 family transcriptional regulator [Thioalkalivibrio sp.]
MKLTTRGRYAVTAILDVALYAGDGPVPLGDVAERQRLSLSYLEQLFARLRRQGLVRSSRGPGGGYELSRPAGEISVAEVIFAVDEPVDVTRCGGLVNCNQDSRCLTHDLWVELSRKMDEFFSSRTLADVLERQRKVRGGGGGDELEADGGRPVPASKRRIPIVPVVEAREA